MIPTLKGVEFKLKYKKKDVYIEPEHTLDKFGVDTGDVLVIEAVPKKSTNQTKVEIQIELPLFVEWNCPKQVKIIIDFQENTTSLITQVFE